MKNFRRHILVLVIIMCLIVSSSFDVVAESSSYSNSFVNEYIDSYIDDGSNINIIQFITHMYNDKSLKTKDKKQIQKFLDYYSYHYKYVNCTSDLLENYYFLFKHNIKLSNIGFTGDVIEWESNNRDYNWYEDQYSTGIYGYNNCGTSVATMAIKWVDKSFNKTGEDARSTYFLNGGWWYTDTIVRYLADNKITTYYSEYEYSIKQIKDIIKNDQIAILCINTNYLNYEIGNTSIGRYYPASNGHFLIVYGYVQTTDNFYLQVYDPLSNGQKNSFGILKGMFRFYDFDEINQCVKHKWEYIIIVYK